MSIRRNRGLAAAAGVGAVVSSVGTTMLGLTAPAIAVTTTPTCDATATDANVTAALGTTNVALQAAYLKSKPYLALHAATLKAKVAYTKGKKAQKPLLLKKYKAAFAREIAGILAFRKVAYYSSFSGMATPPRIATNVPTTHPGLWDWGTYTTRVLIRGGAVVDVCTFVDQTNDGNDQGTAASAQDKLDSASLYQGADKPMSLAIPGQLPVMWYATLAKPAKVQTAIEANVSQCVTQSYMVNTAPCIKGGLTDPTTHLTGATYTVQGYETSLHAALTNAKAAKAIG